MIGRENAAAHCRGLGIYFTQFLHRPSLGGAVFLDLDGRFVPPAEAAAELPRARGLPNRVQVSAAKFGGSSGGNRAQGLRFLNFELPSSSPFG